MTRIAVPPDAKRELPRYDGAALFRRFLMIQSADKDSLDTTTSEQQTEAVVLARYGLVPQVAKFSLSEQQDEAPASSLHRGVQVVVETERGTELADVLELLNPGVNGSNENITGAIRRVATSSDVLEHSTRRQQSNSEFAEWQQRIADWNLQLQVIDAERTLDDKIILYVLNSQNAETTRLALLTAAAGLGIIHVQPVSAEGIVNETSGGCGSGGCGCKH